MQSKTSCKNLEIRSEEQSCKAPEKKTLPKLRVCSCCRSATTDYSTFNRTPQNSIAPAKDSKRVATTLSPCLCSCPSSLSLSFVCVLAVDLRPQRIQSHSSNSIITATDSKHVATALSLSLSLSLSASPSLFLSLFLLLIDLRPQRIESHSLKTPLSRATDSKSHRENTYRKRPEKHFQRRKLFCNRDRKSQQQEHGTQKHTHEREREREKAERRRRRGER